MSTMYSIGAMNQLADALEKAGFTQDEITKLKQFKDLKGIKAVLNGQAEITFPEKKWFEENGIIYFSVTSDGTTGEQWIARLESKGFRVSDYAKIILRSKSFKPTTGVAYVIAVLKGELFSDSNRITKKIRAEAESRKLTKPNAEVACLIRENFSDEEIEAMGLYWIVAMHEPIKNFVGSPILLYARRSVLGSWLDIADFGRPDDEWGPSHGFAFVVRQVSGS